MNLSNQEAIYAGTLGAAIGIVYTVTSTTWGDATFADVVLTDVLAAACIGAIAGILALPCDGTCDAAAMPPLDLGNRQPTVQRYHAKWWPFPRKAASNAKPAIAPVAKPPVAEPRPQLPRSSTSVTRQTGTAPPPVAMTKPRAGWLAREAVTLLGMMGAGLTVLTQLAWYVRMSPPFMDILGSWMTINSNFWLSYYDRLGFYPHSHLQAAIALAVFLSLIGLGARISALASGTPLQRRWSLFEGMTGPSLAIMGALGIIFLLGHDPGASTDDSSRETIKYLFALILAAGYGLGDYLGQRGFHARLYRLAFLLVLLLGLNRWLLLSH